MLKFRRPLLLGNCRRWIHSPQGVSRFDFALLDSWFSFVKTVCFPFFLVAFRVLTQIPTRDPCFFAFLYLVTLKASTPHHEVPWNPILTNLNMNSNISCPICCFSLDQVCVSKRLGNRLVGCSQQATNPWPPQL